MISYEANRFGNSNYIEYSVLTDFCFPLHLHRCLEFVMVTDGTLGIGINTEKYLVHQGEGVLILSNEPHSFFSDEHSAMKSVIFSPELVPSFLNRVGEKTAMNPVFSVSPLLMDTLIPAFSGQKPVDVLEAKGILYLLCSSFLQQVTLVKNGSKNLPLLNRILSYVEEHFAENLTLSTLSAALGYDYYYLSRYFSNTLRIPFHSYLTEYRICYAASLIEQKKYPITDIAYLSGFSSIRTFNAAFQKVKGMTPSAFRKSLQDNYYKTVFP